MPSNLPPGVNEGMIPGNRPEDIAWENLHEGIDQDASMEGMSDIDTMVAWKIGLAAWKASKKYGAKFVHEPDFLPPQPDAL